MISWPPRHFHALALDYDGTIAQEGVVSPSTIEALRRVKESGRKLILVTGRERPDIDALFPEQELFDWMVLENGAMIVHPESSKYELLGKPPPGDFIRRLEEKHVRFQVGKVILASWEPYEVEILEAIKDLGLELQVIFNKGAVMVLPANVNKASGLKQVLERLGISAQNVVGGGDAENDHAFLRMCGCSAAVANALPKLKERVDMVLQGERGAGIEELIELLVADDMQSMSDRLGRHRVRLGKTDDGERIETPAFGANILIVGGSGGGKSTLTTGLMERFVEHSMQFCIIDPEGDHTEFDEAMMLGTAKNQPSTEEIIDFLQNVDRSIVVNLLACPLQGRPSFFHQLLPQLLVHREQTGRPHWIIVDEAHHMLPGPWDYASQPFPKDIERMVYITMQPSNLPDVILKTIDIMIVVGPEPEHAIVDFCNVIQIDPPVLEGVNLSKEEALVWMRTEGRDPIKIHRPPNRTVHRRHSRKYAEGELSPERSFYFRGLEQKLNIRAQNVFLFLQIAEGVDEGTLMHHAQAHDYSQWFTQQVKDPEVGKKIRLLEDQKDLTQETLLKGLRTIIDETYTLPGGRTA